MARYYDMDKLGELIEAKADTLINGKVAFLYVAKWLELLPSADVVPRGDVERLTVELEAMRTAASSYKMQYEELAGEIFGEIEKNECHDISGKTTMYILFAEEFAKLKKRYGIMQGAPAEK